MKQPIVYILDSLRVNGEIIDRRSEENSLAVYESIIKIIEALVRYTKAHEKQSLPKVEALANKSIIDWNRKINDTKERLGYLTFTEPPHQIVQ